MIGTPTDEIQHIIENKQWGKYFIGIHGSPQNKKYWVDFLMKTHQLKPNETVFIGDAPTDFGSSSTRKFLFYSENNRRK